MGLNADTAIRLIARHGRAVTFLRVTTSTPDGGGGVIGGAEVEYMATAFIASFDDELVSQGGGIVRAGGVKALVSVDELAITPQTGDRLRIGTEILNIVEASPIAPDGMVRFWQIHGRVT